MSWIQKATDKSTFFMPYHVPFYSRFIRGWIGLWHGV